MKTSLSRKEAEEIQRIVSLSNASDGTVYSAPLDADLYFLGTCRGETAAFLAVYFMGETEKRHPVCELLLFTRPDLRGQGRMKRLIGKMEETFSGEKERNRPVWRILAYDSRAAEGFLKKKSFTRRYDELLMLKEESAETAPESPAFGEETLRTDMPASACGEGSFHFENDHSETDVRISGNTAFFSGVRTDTSWLRKGYAGQLLNDTVQILKRRGIRTFLLQVSSENKAAVSLYTKLGFTVAERLGVWYHSSGKA